MRLDYLTIFPDYLTPLRQSLTGKAEAKGLLELHVHDLREWAHDRHKTVDDSPFGGGAGMVMRPEPFGEALDELGLDGATVVVPTPSGQPLTQALARSLSTRSRLVFLCGRYEGIDQRVLDHVAARTELVEESHEDGLLEYPVFTRPASWRGLDVPPVLLSGDHAAIAAWRREQSRLRTAQRRPDLLGPSVVGEWSLVPATLGDAGELLTLQRACWVQEALANDDLASIPPLHESLDDVRAWLGAWSTWVVRSEGRLVGAVRGRLTDDGAWDIGRLMVAPDLQGRGLGRVLLEHAQAAAPAAASSYVLFTGARSADNLRMYKKAGFRVRPDLPAPPMAVVLTKRRISGA